MKRTLLLFVLGLSLTCAAWAQSPGSTNAPAKSPPPGGPPPGGHMGMGSLTDEERQELHAARDAALQADPDLAAEGQDLMDKMKAYQQKVDAAMIKADPKLAPIIAKMEAGRHGPGAGGPPPPATNSIIPPPKPASGT